LYSANIKLAFICLTGFVVLPSVTSLIVANGTKDKTTSLITTFTVLLFGLIYYKFFYLPEESKQEDRFVMKNSLVLLVLRINWSLFVLMFRVMDVFLDLPAP